MSGHKPFFVTGANAKLKVNGKTIAMCTDVSYSVRINHAAPHVLGVYEAFTQEPLSYTVTGSFTVIRYIKGLKDWAGGAGDVPGVFGEALNVLPSVLGIQKSSGVINAPDGTSNQGNGVGSWGPQEGIGSIAGTLGIGSQSRTDQSLDPSKLHVPMMFDVEIIQKAGRDGSGVLARLRGCRITGSDFRMSKRGVAQQTFTFQACYADEDSFQANDSGVGQTTY